MNFDLEIKVFIFSKFHHEVRLVQQNKMKLVLRKFNKKNMRALNL